MPMTFPDMKSLQQRAKQRGFRDAGVAEFESDYREAFAKFMENVDRVEAAEIRLGVHSDFVREQDPAGMLKAMGIDTSDLFK